MADQNENLIVPIPKPPSLIEQILKYGKLGAIALVLLAGSLLGLQASGTIALPASVIGILTAIAGLGAALGIGSQGLSAKPAEPKVGPPAE